MPVWSSALIGFMPRCRTGASLYQLLYDNAGLFGAPCLSILIDRAGPVLEATEIVDVVVTHILEQLAGEARSPA